VKKSLVRKSTLIIPNMGEMKLIQKYFDTANGNKLRTYRKLKEKFVTDTSLFLDIDNILIKTTYANKN
jgi:hydroxymethylpyrimidine/phosphomethylpyrimidine kinase